MRRLIFVPLAVVALLAVGASPVAAHASLTGTEPVANQSVEVPPDEILLTFSEAVDVGLGGVRLYDSNGALVNTAGVDTIMADSVVRVSTPGLESGSYVVTFRVTSEDGHPVQGAFTFQAGDSGAVVAGLADRLLAAQGASVALGVLDAALRFAVYLFLVLLLGPPAFAWFCRRGEPWWPAVRVITWIGWAGALGVTVAGFLVRGPYVAGFPLGEALDPDVLSEMLDSRFGRLSIGRLLLLLVVALLLPRLARGADRRALLAAALVGVGLLVTVSGAGHAATGDQVALATTADVVHLGAVCVWLGGLAVLVASALRPPAPPDAVPVVERFSRLALVLVGVAVATGAYQAWRLVRSFDGLQDTDYGHILLVKLALVSVLVAVAATSRNLVRRHLEPAEVRHGMAAVSGAAVDEIPVAEHEGDARPAVIFSTLRRRVAVEVVFAVVVLAVTAVLVNAAPAVDELAAPYHAVAEGDDMDFDLLVTPGGAGRNDIHVQALDPNGVQADVIDMKVWVSEPSRDIALIEAPLRRLGPGHYFSPGFAFPFGGEWTIDVRAFRDSVDFVDASESVPLR